MIGLTVLLCFFRALRAMLNVTNIINKDISVKEQLIKNTFNQWIYIDPDDQIGKKIKKYGLYDTSSISFMRSLLKKIDAPVVMDIGANIGNHLMPILPLVKKAIAFEPQPKTFNKLNRSINKNGFTNCIIKNFGLGYKDENLTFYEDVTGNNGGSSFVKEESSDKDKIIPSLPIKNGDKVLDDLQVNKLDFIKIDVEGFEFEVFKGIENSIKKYSPIILMEWHSHTTGRDFINNDVFNTIFAGYQVVALENKYSWWVRNKLWSLREVVGRKQLEKFELINFDHNQDYNNILLFKKQHQKIVDDIRVC